MFQMQLCLPQLTDSIQKIIIDPETEIERIRSGEYRKHYADERRDEWGIRQRGFRKDHRVYSVSCAPWRIDRTIGDQATRGDSRRRSGYSIEEMNLVFRGTRDTDGISQVCPSER